MKKITVVWSIILVLLAAGMLSAEVNVTFKVNSSTVEGFTDSTEVLQVRGGTPPLDWNANSPELVNVGGDYWEATVAFDDSYIGNTVQWKIGATRTDLMTGQQSDFWEDYPGGGNRSFVLADTDMELDLAYVSSTEPPYTPTDSVDVFFRLNMSTSSFDPETEVLSIVGHLPNPAHDGDMWSPGTYPLTREGESDFYNIHVKIAQAYMDTVENILFDPAWPEDAHGMHMYRFAIGFDWTSENLNGAYFTNPDGSPNENRVIYFKNTTGDTTIAWKYYNDVAPSLGQDSLLMKWRADLTNAIADNGYTPGDTLLVRYGDNNTAEFGTDTLAKVGLSGNFYESTEGGIWLRGITLSNEEENNIQYNYYLLVDGTAQREVFFDYESEAAGGEAEKRKLVTPASPTTDLIIVEDVEDSQTSMRRQPQFPNNSVLPKEVTVFWECDLRPPFYQAMSGDSIYNIQGDNEEYGPNTYNDIITDGVWINGPATGDWTGWGTDLRFATEKQMHDDGTTGGDMTAGDSIFTVSWFYDGPDSSDTYGQVYKFGIYGGDNEAGSTVGFGNNHLANIPIAEPGNTEPEEVTIHTQFGSINPGYYTMWDFDLGQVGVNDAQPEVIKTPNLRQNYPNPFNPVTTINFSLPSAMDVRLVVYNSLGQKVVTLLNGKQRQGAHVVQWNGLDSHGQAVGTGVYFYKLTAGDYTKTMKMMLLK